jgi:hypothetical protein
MRLIDADALKESLNEKGQEYYYDYETLEPMGKTYDESEVMEAIDDSTTEQSFTFGKVGVWIRERFPYPCKYEEGGGIIERTRNGGVEA